MTNFELAQTLVRLGAVTGSAFDGGGSSTLAFDGQLLNRPSDSGGERPSRPRSSSCTTASTRRRPTPVDLAERRRLRRGAARALVQGRAPVGRHRDPRRAGRQRLPSPRRFGASRARTRSRSRPRRSIRSPSRRRRPRAAGGSTSRRPTTRRAPRRRARRSPSTTRSASRSSRAATLVVRVRGKQTIQAGVDADAAGAGDGHGRDDVGRPGRDDRDPPRCPPGRFVAPAGTARRAAASSSSTAASTWSASARRTSSARSSSSATPVPRHPRGAAAGQEAEATQGLESPRRAGRVDPVRGSPTPSRPSSATTGSTPSSC